jgi:hypothetical protein
VAQDTHCHSAFPVRPLWIFRLPTLSDCNDSTSVPEESAAFQRHNDLSVSRFFIRDNPCEFALVLFLNCTKNTELTSAVFTRTFTFALTKKAAGPVAVAA